MASEYQGRIHIVAHQSIKDDATWMAQFGDVFSLNGSGETSLNERLAFNYAKRLVFPATPSTVRAYAVSAPVKLSMRDGLINLVKATPLFGAGAGAFANQPKVWYVVTYAEAVNGHNVNEVYDCWPADLQGGTPGTQNVTFQAVLTALQNRYGLVLMAESAL